MREMRSGEMDGERAMALRQGARAAGAPRGAPAAYEQAFIEAYQCYYTKVFAYVYSRVGNVEVSKDLVAEVFEKAYVKGHGVREPAAYATWLFMVAKNVVIGHYRRHKREISGMDRMKESLSLSDPPANPEDRTLRRETVFNLMRHLRRLSRRDQELLSLKFEAELGYAEIGAVLGLSDVNVRVSIFRALKRLRALMEKE